MTRDRLRLAVATVSVLGLLAGGGAAIASAASGGTTSTTTSTSTTKSSGSSSGSTSPSHSGGSARNWAGCSMSSFQPSAISPRPDQARRR